MTEPWRHGYAETNGIRMHYLEAGQGYPVLLLHGFPELAFSWRYQLPALAAAGYRAIAPDLRGYGETDKPHAIAAYTIQELEADIVGLLDALDIERCAVAGHDWGAIITWHLALARPDRFERIIALNVPFTPRVDVKPTDRFRATPDGRFNYILAFQAEGVAEANMERDLRGSLGGMMRRICADPAAISDADLDVYVEAFARGGLRGPINYYRNFDANWESTPHFAGQKVEQPTLMIVTDKDPILRPEGAAGIERHVPNVRTVLISDCGHWTQQEKPDEVNAAIIAFLRQTGR
ncbi:MAG TPA: alpha/beta hydrolase [Dehalococcoidia bacterium]|nr:alpha/beta hydrolase [Dehalococcoidia bacterium]